MTNDDLSRREFSRRLGAVAVGGAILPNTLMSDASSPDRSPAIAAHTTPDAAVSGNVASELCYMSATQLAAMIRAKKVSAREVMQAHLAQIERVNPKVNAIVTLVADKAMTAATAADEAIAKGRTLGALHGLPIAHKDLVATAGIRTTQGSPFYRDFVPTKDAGIIQRIHAAGALTLGKTNTPEFGAGSHTFNTVFGATHNPYDVNKTCGGSSGGAAVSLACGMVPIADGSDTGGSLRNPASWCNVVGFRPSPGRVASDSHTWSPLSTSGPMARSVADAALLLSAIAGPDAHNPLSIDENPAQFAKPLDRNFKGVRIAWHKGLGGLPFEPQIRRIIDDQRKTFEALGCVVEDAEPDFTGVDFAFPTLRHMSYHTSYAGLAKQRPDWVKDTIRWEIAEAERQTAVDVADASARQSLLFEQTTTFFQRYEFFVLPVTQLAPFDINIKYPTEVAGVAMPTYIDWMRSCWYVSFMGNPAISVPAGFTDSGLPVGIQIVGRMRADLSVLQMGHAFEQATHVGARRPGVVNG